MKTKIQLILAAVGLLVWSTAAHAQTSTTGAVRGVVTDRATGDVVIGATVVATSPVLQGTQAAITDESGSYYVSNLPPGTYELSVYYADAQFSRTNVLVQLGKVAKVNIEISTEAAAGETIVIEGRAPLIDQGSTKTGVTITSDYTQNLPTGRTFGSVIGSAAGATGDTYGTSFSGSTSAENIYIVEGINTTDPGFGLLSTNLPHEFIRETEVITGGYNAEYGRSTGGIINVITKSGSNEFHGSVFGYYTPGALSPDQKEIPVAGSAISSEDNLAHAIDFGAELGGPIVQDKLWFHVGISPSLSSTDVDRIVQRQVDADGDGIPDVGEDGFREFEELSRTTRQESQAIVYYTGKISGAVSPEHQGSVSVLGSPRTRDVIGALAAEETANTFDITDNIFDGSVKWTSKFFENQTQIDAVVGHHRDTQNQSAAFEDRGVTSHIRYETGRPLTEFAPYEPGGMVPEGCIDDDPDDDFVPCPTDLYRIGGVGFLEDTTSTRTSALLSLTQRARAAGHHVIKVGLEYEGQGFDDARGYTGEGFMRERPGGAWLRYRLFTPRAGDPMDPSFIECGGVDTDGDGVPEIEPTTCGLANADGIPGRLSASTNTRNLGAYVQDSWSILPNLTLNAGVRWEQQTLYNAEEIQGQVSPLTGEPFDETAFTLSNMLAPRLGVIYDWTQEGRSKVFAHWGRFYESIPMDINSRAFGGEVLNIDVIAPGGCAGEPADMPEGVCDPDAQLFNVPLGEGEEAVVPGIKAQYMDEFVLGSEYEILEDLKIGANYIYRDLGRIIEDISPDGGSTYVIANPGEVDEGAVADLRAEADRVEAADPQRATLLRHQADLFELSGTFDDPKRTYQALQLTADRRFTENIFVQASYTFSKTKGNFPGLFSPETGQLDPNLTSMYDLPDLMANRYGDLAADQPHLLKIDGYYRLNLQQAGLLTFGGRFRASSGIPINTLGAHPVYGRQESYILPRGTAGRTDFVSRVDTHIAYGRRLTDGVILEAFVDVFNLFNQQPGTRADEEYTLDDVNPIVGGDAEDLEHLKVVGTNTVATPRPNWKNASARQAPLSMRFGLRLTF